MPVSAVNPDAPISAESVAGNGFFPLDLLIGKRLTKNILVSVEASAPLIRGYNLYEFRLQTRLSFTF
jgi:hypothetical protein